MDDHAGRRDDLGERAEGSVPLREVALREREHLDTLELHGTVVLSPVAPSTDLASVHGVTLRATRVAQVSCDAGIDLAGGDDSSAGDSSDDGSCGSSCDDGSDDGSSDDGSGDDGSGDDGSGDD